MSEYVGNNKPQPYTSYTRPSRRSGQVNFILPGIRKIGIPDIVVLWDTSGSMYGQETQILGELNGICEDTNTTVRVICCDCAVHGDYDDISNATDFIKAGGPKGGGGSDFSPAFTLLEKEYYEGIVIAFTDGYIHVPPFMPERMKGVLFVVTEGGVNPTQGAWGSAIFIDKKGNIIKNKTVHV